jgi:hypothetical protein
MPSVLHFAANGSTFKENSVAKETECAARSKDSYEEVPLFTAMTTYMGFYFLMVLGFINTFFFTPKVTQEKNREV